jgi:hypothetical protein
VFILKSGDFLGFRGDGRLDLVSIRVIVGVGVHSKSDSSSNSSISTRYIIEYAVKFDVYNIDLLSAINRRGTSLAFHQCRNYIVK